MAEAAACEKSGVDWEVTPAWQLKTPPGRSALRLEPALKSEQKSGGPAPFTLLLTDPSPSWSGTLFWGKEMIQK